MEALRQERWQDAVSALQDVASDPELAQAADLEDVRLRACTLLAQALIAADQPGPAGPWLDEADRLLAKLDDANGRAVVQQLRRQRTDRLMAQAARAKHAAQLAELANTPEHVIRARAFTPEMLQDLLVQKANAEIEAGRPEEGGRLAQEALELAIEQDTVRGEVLARLSLARALPETAQEQLYLAWSRAERANEFNLVGAVARAAELQGVALPTLQGPDLGRS